MAKLRALKSGNTNTVSALVLAFVPTVIALGGGYAVGQIHGARRERRNVDAKRAGQLHK
ncbi:MAG: hypothetical protein ACRDLT_09210 [Solirubrobacteraceae bacterium]